MSIHRRTVVAALPVWAAVTPIALRAQGAQPGASASACPALLQHTLSRLQDAAPQALCQYAGKVLLIVNTASQCGYTPQYKGLEALHARYAQRGLAVLGFPANDFGNQEPGDAAKIGETCFNFYGVRFAMFGKIVVKGAKAHPLYQQLAQATGQEPKWNFHKYLVDRQGRAVVSFDGAIEPQAPRLVADIERLLEQT